MPRPRKRTQDITDDQLSRAQTQALEYGHNDVAAAISSLRLAMEQKGLRRLTIKRDTGARKERR